MPYAILRFQKRKGGAIHSVEKHHERMKDAYKSNPDIDVSRSAGNYHLLKPAHSYRQEVNRRIEQTGCRVRKDSVRMVDTIITASNEYLTRMSPDEQRRFFEHAFAFIEQEIGRQNIISAVVHMDERTPHMHLVFCPITPDGHLSAKEIVGNQKKLSEWQSKYYDYMREIYPKLERGESAMKSGREHIPTWLLKEATNLDRQAEQVKTVLSNINALNAGHKRDEAVALIAQWLPNAMRFSDDAKRTEERLRASERRNKAQARKLEEMQGALDKSQNAEKRLRFDHAFELADLQETVRKQNRLIERIPPELLEQALEKPERIEKDMER